MRFGKIAALSSILLMGVGGACWQYSSNEFEKVINNSLESFKKIPSVQMGPVTISKYMYKVTIKDVSFSSPKVDIFPPLSLKLSGDVDIRFNPFTKKTTISTSSDYASSVEFGKFKETFKQVTVGQEGVMVISHKAYPTSSMDGWDFLKNISSVSFKSGSAKYTNAQGDMLFSSQGGAADYSWSLSPDQKFTLKVDSDARDMVLNTKAMIDMVKGIVTQIDLGAEVQAEIEKLGEMDLMLPKDQRVHMDLSLDYAKAKALYEKGLTGLQPQDVPQVALKATYDSGYVVGKSTTDIELNTSKEAQKINLTWSGEYPGERLGLAEFVFGILEKGISREKLPLTLDKDAFMKGFPDVAKAGRLSYSIHADGQFVDTINIAKAGFEFKTKDYAIAAEGSGNMDKISGELNVVNYKAMLDSTAELAQWVSSVLGAGTPEVKQFVDTSVPFYHKTALFIMEKVGEPKPSKNDASFRLDGNLKEYKINGKKVEEWLPIIMMGGLLDGVSQPAPEAEPAAPAK
jgi:hypothetical protein